MQSGATLLLACWLDHWERWFRLHLQFPAAINTAVKCAYIVSKAWLNMQYIQAE